MLDQRCIPLAELEITAGAKLHFWAARGPSVSPTSGRMIEEKLHKFSSVKLNVFYTKKFTKLFLLEKSCKRSCILQQKPCHVLQQYAAKGVGKWCFAFYHQRSSLCCNNQVVGNCVNTDFWLHKIRRELRHSLEKKFPWAGKTRNSHRFYCKKDPLNTH